MKESLQKEIIELSNQRDELNQKISQKRLELNEYLIQEEIKKYEQASDKLNYLCFESTFDKGNICDSQGQFVISELMNKELSQFFSTEDNKITHENARYLFHPWKGTFESQFQNSNLALSNVKKIESFLVANKDKMMKYNHENKKIFKTNEDFVLIDPCISDIREGVVFILWNESSSTIIKQRHTVNITLIKKCDTLEQAYHYLKNFSLEMEQYNCYE